MQIAKLLGVSQQIITAAYDVGRHRIQVKAPPTIAVRLKGLMKELIGASGTSAKGGRRTSYNNSSNATSAYPKA